MKPRSLNKANIGITNEYELRFLYIPKDFLFKYEILTFKRYDGVVRATAHAYKGEYRHRQYVGERIVINSSNDTDFDSIKRTHDKAKKMLRKYHLVKYNSLINQ